MTDYEKLMGELETLQKSTPTGGDAAIAAAAGEPAAAEAAKEAGEEGAEPKKEGEPKDGEKPPMAKSFTVDVAGEPREAVEVDALIKSLQDHADTRIATAMGPVVGLLKSLVGQVADLSKTATPRKSVIAIAEKAPASPLAKSEPQGLTAGEFMAKSDAAYAAGKISGVEFTTIDVCLRKGQPVDAGLIQRVVG